MPTSLIRNRSSRTYAASPSTSSPGLPPLDAGLPRGLRLVPVRHDLTRICGNDGGIRGHIRALATPEGIRVRAEVYHRRSRAFFVVGEFWRTSDAVAAVAAA